MDLLCLSTLLTQPAHFHYSSEPMTPEVASHLVENHREFLSFLESRVGDRAVAEDILQDAFVKTIEKGEAIRDQDSAIAWFYRLLRNAVVDCVPARRATQPQITPLISGGSAWLHCPR